MITRPIDASNDLKSELSDINPKLYVVQSPLIEIKPRKFELPPKKYDGVILTSQNAIKSLGDCIDSLSGKKAYCVGEKTSELAKAKGIDVIAFARNSEDLIQAIIKLQPKGGLLYFRGHEVSNDLNGLLKNQGIKIDELVVYDQNPTPLTAKAIEILATSDCIIPLYSIRTAKLFSREVSKIIHKKHTIFGISRGVIQACGLPWKSVIADPPNLQSFASQIVKIAQ